MPRYKDSPEFNAKIFSVKAVTSFCLVTLRLRCPFQCIKILFVKGDGCFFIFSVLGLDF